ncbi:hypothetical protein FB451DRAFT_1164712 [Mycena latifolia]|nr:hypothetical protein FB451DRAFT_1164712 [Mycena latifolia]
MESARRHFPTVDHSRLVSQTDQLAIADAELVDISPESWEIVVDLVSSVFIAETHKCLKEAGPAISLAPSSSAEDHYFPSISERLWGKKIQVSKVSYDGAYLKYGDTPDRRGVEDGDGIDPVSCRGGSIGRSHLDSEWSFSAVYPIVPTKSLPSGAGDRIQCPYRRKSDRVKHRLGCRVSFLGGAIRRLMSFLPAYTYGFSSSTNDDIPVSPPAPPIIGPRDVGESFSPLTCALSPTDSVLLAARDITPYLGKVLLTLGLHTEARTSFITYWLPSSDVITRVVIVFKGISDDELAIWDGSKPTEANAERWKSVVGVDVTRRYGSAQFEKAQIIACN